MDTNVEIKKALDWQSAGEFSDILYDKAEGIAKLTINRPRVRNAFRPETVLQLCQAFADAREDPELGVIILTGAGPLAFCSGGDQKGRGNGGYVGKCAGFSAHDPHLPETRYRYGCGLRYRRRSRSSHAL